MTPPPPPRHRAAPAAGQPLLTIGQLARRTGLTLRTLRHYEQLGLIEPPLRMASGYRVYDASRIAQLYRALALKALRVPLKEIAAQRGIAPDPQALIGRQIEATRALLSQQQQLLLRLTEIQSWLQRSPEVTTETLLQAIEVTTMFDKYFTTQQREELKERAATLGSEIQDAQQAWPRLLAEMGAHYDAGTPPTDPRVRALARQWVDLVHQFTGGDPQIAANLTRMYQQETQAQQQFGVRPELFAYVRAASA